MIPPYKETFKPSSYGLTLDDYAKNTVLVCGQYEVSRHLRWYLWKMEENCKTEVLSVIRSLLDCPHLLCKTQIVTLVSWRNCVMTIRPDCVLYDREFGSLTDALNYYATQAQALFLYLHMEPMSSMYLNLSGAAAKEKENACYFQDVRSRWRAEYSCLKMNKVDEILDLYNQSVKFYALTKDENYRIQAERLKSAFYQL